VPNYSPTPNAPLPVPETSPNPAEPRTASRCITTAKPSTQCPAFPFRIAFRLRPSRPWDLQPRHSGPTIGWAVTCTLPCPSYVHICVLIIGKTNANMIVTSENATTPILTYLPTANAANMTAETCIRACAVLTPTGFNFAGTREGNSCCKSNPFLCYTMPSRNSRFANKPQTAAPT
jgi:hypothetical protein